jgi:GT2 family glycosyltransferase
LEARVHVIVLNWNGWSDTAMCLSSLQRLNYENVKITVIDNGSTDDSAMRVLDAFPGVDVVETGENLGFAGGCNAGIRRVQGADFIWLLNNDTKVHPDALRALVNTAQADPRIGAVGSAIYFLNEPQRLQVWGGGYVNFWLGRSGHFLKPVPDRRIQFLTGASLLLSRAALEAVGVLDEDFFMYWEDADLCFRLRRAGWLLAVAEQSKVWHKGATFVGEGSVNSYRYFNTSASHFFKKHSPAPIFSFWTGFGLRLTKRLLAGDWEKTKASWSGMRQGTGRMVWHGERARIDQARHARELRSSGKL